MTPGELRPLVFARDRGCVWPGCGFEINDLNPLQLCHLTHRGMGGNVNVNVPEEAVALCRFHHDVFDGRQGQGKTRTEIAAMLRAVVGIA